MTKRFPVKAMLCSKLAIATALVVGATPAAAQSLQGTFAPPTGASVNQSVPGLTTVTVTAPQAVIDWTATGPSSGGLTTFQAINTTANFQGTANFAILNRVATTVSTDGIYLNGNINSTVNGLTGGTVYFYSPNGIVVGQNAIINVGSLGLTTSPIANDGSGNWMTGFGGASPSVTFGAAATNSYVRTDTGSLIKSNG
ncbi:MAG: filamentous hemagglutinin N-terminal domain-containing protein, partial [Sphingomonas bacterium]|nr:filamentous hemagglutinin N-terminal domain-containing protein [Sphingomonas bacterium]